MSTVTENSRNAFIKAMLPYAYDKEGVDEASETVSALIKLSGLSQSSKVLDIPSFGGVYALALAKQGFHVTSCDEISESLQLGKEQALKQKLQVDWIEQNPFHFKKANFFKGVFSLGYSFGDYENREMDNMMLSNVYQSLNNGGKLVLQIIGRDILEKYFTPKFWIEQSDGSFLLNERQIDYSSGLLTENYTFLKGGDVSRFVYGRKLYYPDEIRSLLASHGYRGIKIFGNLQGNEYDDQAKSLIVIAEKIVQETNNFIRC